MSIDARGAFSSVDYGSCTGYANISSTGTDDGGGGGTLEDIRTQGGRFGVRGGGVFICIIHNLFASRTSLSAYSVLVAVSQTNWMWRTLHVENASEAGLLLNTGSWNNVFLDVHVSSSPVAVNLSQHNNNIVMLDSVFEVPNLGTGLALFNVNPNGTGIAMSRVTVTGGEWAVRGPTVATSVRQEVSGAYAVG